METNSMDPYEAQLHSVFTNFADSYGTLDSNSLTNLCAALQMDPGPTEELLTLAQRSGQQVTFSRFRDSLVEVLGGDPNSHSSTVCHSDDKSPRKELSPKYVYGSKKYGRRSRPRDSSVSTMSNIDHCSDSVPTSSSNHNTDKHDELQPSQTACKKDSLEMSPLKTIEIEHNKTIDFHEAVALCRTMRMTTINMELIKEVFLEEVNTDGKITIGEFFHHLNKKLITSISVEKINLPSNESETAKWEGADWVERDLVIDMWERAGILHCRQILHDLGFTEERLNVSQLTASLDNEIKCLFGGVNKISGTNVPSLLLQASLSLHQYEVRCIKDAMDQVFAENTKMKTDLNESNQRAQLLAQEVDDNHAKMETSLKNKVKQLETKHAENIRTINEQLTTERETSNTEIQQLSNKLTMLENEESKLRHRCCALERTNEELERCLTKSDELTHELEDVRIRLMRDIKDLRSEKKESDSPREHHGELERLTALMTDFRIENKTLRDRNDELCIEIEHLQHKLTRENRRLSLGRSKPQCNVDISSEQAMSLLEECEGGWDMRRDGLNATKRRGDSPSKGKFSSEEDESPRVGKLRKCHLEGEIIGHDKDICNDVDWDVESTSDSSLPFHLNIVFKKQTNESCNVEKEAEEKLILSAIEEMLKNVNVTSECESCNTLKDIISKIHKDSNTINTKQFNTTNTETQTKSIDMTEDKNKLADALAELSKVKEDKDKASTMVRDLESSLEQLKSEYDKCEEYWTNKLDEEREIFNEEQKISDEKFQDLLLKISEYEEQFVPTQKNDSKLPTIEEKYSLELQFAELEDEFEQYKKKQTLEIQSKMKEIEHLKHEIKNMNHSNVSTDSNSINSHGIKLEFQSDEIDGPQCKVGSPIDYLWKQSTIQSPNLKGDDQKRDYQNPAYSKLSNQDTDKVTQSSSDNEKDFVTVDPIKKPSVPNKKVKQEVGSDVSSDHPGPMSTCCDRSVKECNQETATRSNRMIQCSELEGQLRKHSQNSQNAGSTWANGGDCQSGPTSSNCLFLEQRCRQLSVMLKQHQMYLEKVQHNARLENSSLRQKLFHAENAIAQLQRQLFSNDLLVKELYVENCQMSTTYKPPLI